MTTREAVWDNRRMTRPTHVITIFPVADVARALAFYRDVIGLAVRVDLPVFAQLDTAPHAALGLYEREAFTQTAGLSEVPPPGGTELYLSVPDLDAAIERALQAGATLTSPKAVRAWGDEVAYFLDPDGNVVALAHALQDD